MLIYYCHLYISPQRIHSFQSCYGWTNKNFDCWGFQKETFHWYIQSKTRGSLLLPLIHWKLRKFRWLHLGYIHEIHVDLFVSYKSQIILKIQCYCTFIPPPFCYWWLIMQKCSWKLYRSPNHNPREVQKCNSTEDSLSSSIVFSHIPHK